MRNLLTLIILGVLGYYGWQTWQTHPEYFTKFLPKQQEEASTDAAASDAATANAAQVPSVPAAPAAPPPPKFTSKIAVPEPAAGETQTMPPGQFLVVERASVETHDGIVAIVPGDSVKLLERRNDGTLKVTNGENDFVVKETQVTQDIAAARDAERRDFERRFGRAR